MDEESELMTDEELWKLRVTNREGLAALKAAGMVVDDATLRTHCLLEFLIGSERMPDAERYFEQSLEDTIAKARQSLARMQLTRPA